MATDVFRVSAEGGRVKFYKGPAGGSLVLLYTSTPSPTYPLRADRSFYHTGGTVKAAKVQRHP